MTGGLYKSMNNTLQWKIIIIKGGNAIERALFAGS